MTVVGAAALAFSAAPSAQPDSPSVRDAVARYARGDFDATLRDFDARELTITEFSRALEAWIADGAPAAEPRRRLNAAAFALDVVWTATRRDYNSWERDADSTVGVSPPLHPDRVRLGRLQSPPFVVRWAVQRFPATPTPDRFERALWLAATGIVEDSHAWHRLRDELLPLARRRLPDEPRLRLAEVLARTTADLGTFYFRRRSFQRADLLVLEPVPSRVTSRIPKAIQAFEPLLAEVSLSGEVELRIGYLELRRKGWPAALARFDAARSKAAEPVLRATADYFAGFVYEQLNQPEQAIAAYRRAHALAPLVRNLATRLAALLFLRNERVEAYAALDLALNARPAPLDLLIALERADSRFVPEWLQEVRTGLR